MSTRIEITGEMVNRGMRTGNCPLCGDDRFTLDSETDRRDMIREFLEWAVNGAQPGNTAPWCGRKLATGQHWSFCGETDMGQTEAALCVNCGGHLSLADDVGIV